MRIPRTILPLIALAAAAWSAALTLGSGIALRTPLGSVSSRDPVRPLAIAIGLGLVSVFIDRQWRNAISDERRGARVALALAGLIAMLALLAGLKFGTYTAGGADPSGYVSQSALWRSGRLIRPAPVWVAGAPWPDAARTAAPLGYTPGPTPASQVPTYPAGLPLLMAAARAVGGRDAEYVVVPLSAAILVWVTFLLARRFAGPWPAVAAASLMATSPPFLTWLVMPMSDIPVSACWTVALVGALTGTRRGSAGAGAASALAIVIRPNLAPLAAIVALIVAVRNAGSIRSLMIYAGLTATGPVFVAVTNHFLYGSALRSGYGDLGALYSVDFLWPNIRRYGSWFISTQSPIPLVGLLAPMWAGTQEQRWIYAAVAIGMPAATLCLYLPYLPFDDWSYLRFLLPAYPALFAGLAIALAEGVRRWGRSVPVRFVLAAIVALLCVRGLDYSNAPRDLSVSEPRYRDVAAAAAAVPSNAIFMSFQHSGSLRYYTGRDILRWDLMDRAGVDAALGFLSAQGYRVYWVGDAVERASVEQRFRGSRLEAAVASGPRQVIGDVWLVDLAPES